MHQVQKVSVYILSDSIGETAQYVARAAANQFPGIEVSYKHIPFVEDTAYITDVLERIEPKESILMQNIVKDIDKKAFMVIFDVRRALGEGFYNFEDLDKKI